jgi:multidrug efflux pump subunit AcrB
MARARQLPKDIDPLIFKADPSQLPMVMLTVASDEWDLTKLRTWTENWLQNQLLSVPGVAGTDIVGGLKREIRVHLDPNAVEKYGLTLPAVIKRLQEENLEQFGGRVTAGPREFIAVPSVSTAIWTKSAVVLANGAAGRSATGCSPGGRCARRCASLPAWAAILRQVERLQAGGCQYGGCRQGVQRRIRELQPTAQRH